MSTTVVIVTYNSGIYIERCISSVIKMTENTVFDIIVVDNASRDNTVNLIRSEFPDVRLIENKINAGFSRAVNQAVKESDADYLFLLNPDTILMNNSVKVFSDYLDKKENDNAACVGGELLYEDGKPALSYGFFPSLFQVFFEQFGLRKLFKNYYYENLSPGCYSAGNAEKEVDYVCGANLFIRKKVFDKLGSFDENFFLYYEETDFCYRLKKSGLKTMFAPSAKLIHFEGKSAESDSADISLIKKKSEFLFFKKRYGIAGVFLSKIFYITGAVLKAIFLFDSKQIEIIKIIFNA